MDLEALGENTVTIDCDVIQADGGTRTAAISGACVALADAIAVMKRDKLVKADPLLGLVASVSVGIYQGEPVLDLDYLEDSNAETDMNIVMAQNGGIVEIQGTAEADPFSEAEFATMFALAKQGVSRLIELQRKALGIG